MESSADQNDQNARYKLGQKQILYLNKKWKQKNPRAGESKGH